MSGCSWDSKIRTQREDFFNEIISHPVPIEMNTLTALKRSPLGLDLYLWAVTYRTFSADRAPLRLLLAGRCTVSSEWNRIEGQRQSSPSKRLPHGKSCAS